MVQQSQLVIMYIYYGGRIMKRYIRSATNDQAASQMIAELKSYKGTIFEDAADKAIEYADRNYIEYRDMKILDAFEIAEAVADKFEATTGVQPIVHFSRHDVTTAWDLSLSSGFHGCSISADDNVDSAYRRFLSDFNETLKAYYKRACNKHGVMTPQDYADNWNNYEVRDTYVVTDAQTFRNYCQKVLRATYSRNRNR